MIKIFEWKGLSSFSTAVVNLSSKCHITEMSGNQIHRKYQVSGETVERNIFVVL